MAILYVCLKNCTKENVDFRNFQKYNIGFMKFVTWLYYNVGNQHVNVWTPTDTTWFGLLSPEIF